jgi:undecaprenyl diphosphate synthase
MRPLTHLAVIGDGNRRWAEAHGQPPAEGHTASVAALEFLITHWRDRTRDVPGRVFLTFWWSSVDNLRRRDPAELAVLFTAYRRFFDAFDGRATELRAHGQWRDLLPGKTAQSVQAAVARSNSGARHVVSFLLAYNGNEEMLSAIDALRREPAGAPTSDEQLRRHLDTGAQPPIDLNILTGGDAHLSNGFMMWHTQNSQLWFTDVLWPDFDAVELDRALADYAGARRRFGA